MKLKTEDILKPGITRLEPVVIDFNDPEIKEMIAECKREQRRIAMLKPENWTQEEWQALNNVITI